MVGVFIDGSLRSLGIPDATNRKAVLRIAAEAVDILVVVGQVATPCAGATGRGTPPESVVSSAVEVSIAAAEAARQT